MVERLSCKRKEYRRNYRSELRRLRKGRSAQDVVPRSDVVEDVSRPEPPEEERLSDKYHRASGIELSGSVSETIS